LTATGAAIKALETTGSLSSSLSAIDGRAATATAGSLFGVRDPLLGLGLELGIQSGTLGCIFRVDDPARECERNGAREHVGILADRHRHADQFLLLLLGRFNRTKPLPLFVERLGPQRPQIDRAGRHFAHPRFAIKLGRRQVAGNGRIASADADQYADRRQRATENGDGEDDLHEREAAALGTRDCRPPIAIRMTNSQ
jgi:hypothetical protein